MASINLTSGMRNNLISLQDTTTLMETIQKRLSTGKRINTAIDNPTNYFTAANHLARADKLESKKDLMNEAIQTAKAASTGIDGIKKLLESARGIAQSALTATDTSVTNLKNSYNTIMSQIDKMAADSSYRGKNLLNSDSISVVFSETANSQLDVTGFFAKYASLGLDTAGWAATTGSAASLDIAKIDSALTTIETQAQTLAANLNVIQTRAEFTKSLIDTLKEGASKLTDADMNEEGANLLMLQTRQQLGTTSMSMAAQAAQSVLRLF